MWTARADRPASTPSTRSTESTPSTKPSLSPSSSPPGYAEISANGVLALLAVVCPLLDRQMAAQAAAFEKHGGFTERLSRFRRRAIHGRKPAPKGKRPNTGDKSNR